MVARVVHVPFVYPPVLPGVSLYQVLVPAGEAPSAITVPSDSSSMVPIPVGASCCNGIQVPSATASNGDKSPPSASATPIVLLQLAGIRERVLEFFIVAAATATSARRKLRK